MTRKKGFLGASWSKRWDKSYAALSHDRQKGTDKVAIALMKQEPTPGMRVKPIEPEKYYYEARIDDGDRLVFKIEGGAVWFVDMSTTTTSTSTARSSKGSSKGGQKRGAAEKDAASA